jgi:hypothetical protein
VVYAQVKQQRQLSARSQMYMVLEDFAEVLDRDLSQVEYDLILARLEQIIVKKDDAQLVTLASSLKAYLKEKHTELVPHNPGIIERIIRRWKKFETQILTRPRMRLVILLGLLIWAAWAITSQTIMYLTTHNAAQLQLLVEEFMTNNLIRNASGMNWFEAQILLEGSMGILAFIAAIFFLFKKDKIAIWLGIMNLLVTLVVVNLITFYFDQFSTIGFASIEFVLLILLLSYKRRFLDVDPSKNRHSAD